MKQLLGVITVLVITTNINAQTNTFPASGYVGIGTTSPVSQLHVAGNITLSSGSKVVYDPIYEIHGYTRYDYPGLPEAAMLRYGYYGHRFETRQGVALVIRGNNNNVGIGESNPLYKLDVNGTINSTVFSGSNMFLTKNSGASISFNDGTNQNAMIEAGTNNHRLEFWVNNNNSLIERMRIDQNGYVGIGTSAPAQKLDVNGGIQISGDPGLVFANSASGYTGSGIVYGYMSRSSGSGGSYPWNTSGTIVLQSESLSGTGGFAFATGTTPSVKMAILGSGNVGIGTTDPGNYKLAVNGDVKAKKITISQTGWSDYVFDKNYKLRSLEYLEAFIKENKHLPDVPTAKEVNAKGVSVGDTQALLLKKIEELTLYMIEANKKNDQLTKRIESLEKKNRQK